MFGCIRKYFSKFFGPDRKPWNFNKLSTPSFLKTNSQHHSTDQRRHNFQRPYSTFRVPWCPPCSSVWNLHVSHIRFRIDLRLTCWIGCVVYFRSLFISGWYFLNGRNGRYNYTRRHLFYCQCLFTVWKFWCVGGLIIYGWYLEKEF